MGMDSLTTANVLAISFIIVMMFASYAQKQNFYPRKTFYRLSSAICVFLMLDTLYNLAVKVEFLDRLTLLFMIRTLYLLTNVYIAYIWALFVGRMIYEDDFSNKTTHKLLNGTAIFCIAILTVNIFIPIGFRIAENGDLIINPFGAGVFYIGMYGMTIASLVATIRGRKRIRKGFFVPLLTFPIPAIIAETYRVLSPGNDILCFLAFSILIFHFVLQDDIRHIDNLTQISNRRVLHEKLNTWFRSSKYFNVCGIIIDVIDMNSINETYGYVTGDKLLREIASFLSNIKTQHLLPCRYMGDHFILVWRHFPEDGENNIDLVRNEINANIARLNASDKFQAKFSVHMGTYTCPNKGNTQEDFLRNIEFSLSSSQKEIYTILDNAVKNHAFQVAYQPIYDIHAKCFNACEALVRLNIADGPNISPAVFIPAAEECGLINAITDQVLEMVCRFINGPDFEKLGIKCVEVNLSPKQFATPNFAKHITDLVDEYKVDHKYINFEITESALSISKDAYWVEILQLIQAGFELSLDDFGTGYSNIQRLTQTPLRVIKIDRSLVVSSREDDNYRVMHVLIRLLRRMSQIVLIEGIETEQEYEIAAELGCDKIQGYYFSKPLFEEAFRTFILAQNPAIELTPSESKQLEFKFN